jgi:hypothetical protein
MATQVHFPHEEPMKATSDNAELSLSIVVLLLSADEVYDVCLWWAQ